MFCSCYDHQTGEETGEAVSCRSRGWTRDLVEVLRQTSVLCVRYGDASIVPIRVYVLFDDLGQGHIALLLPDQIKPIEQLVPVS